MHEMSIVAGVLDAVQVSAVDAGAERVKNYSVPMACGMTYNYASKQVDEEVLGMLADLAKESDLEGKFKELYNGAMINTGEKRLVLHHLTRGQLGDDVIADGTDKRAFYTGEQAKIAAADAIRQKNMVRRYRVLSSKVQTVAQRLQTAYQNQKLSEQMQNLTQQLLGAGNMMDIVKMTETMSNFEKLFDDLDINSNMMDQVFDNVNAGTVNENEVNQRIGQIAQQNGMKLSDEFEGVQLGEVGEAEKQTNQEIGNDAFPGL